MYLAVLFDSSSPAKQSLFIWALFALFTASYLPNNCPKTLIAAIVQFYFVIYFISSCPLKDITFSVLFSKSVDDSGQGLYVANPDLSFAFSLPVCLPI